MQKTIGPPAPPAEARTRPAGAKKPGRPYIGPKAQAHIWVEIYHAVEREAEERGIPISDVWRELLEEAWAARGNVLGDQK